METGGQDQLRSSGGSQDKAIAQVPVHGMVRKANPGRRADLLTRGVVPGDGHIRVHAAVLVALAEALGAVPHGNQVPVAAFDRSGFGTHRGRTGVGDLGFERRFAGQEDSLVQAEFGSSGGSGRHRPGRRQALVAGDLEVGVGQQIGTDPVQSGREATPAAKRQGNQTKDSPGVGHHLHGSLN